MDWFFLKKALTALVLPPIGPLLLILLGLLILRYRPRLARSSIWIGFLILLGLSTPVVTVALERAVNNGPVFDPSRPQGAQAIVILGGGLRRHASEYGQDTLYYTTLERVRYGARVARQTGLPVLVTGGVVFGGIPEAKVMKQTLENEFAVKVRWAETQSRDTHQNAILSAKILRNAGIGRIILVTHSVHMPRSRSEFVRAGLSVIIAPTVLPFLPYDTILDRFPNPGSLQRSTFALHELLAIAIYRL